MMKYYLMSSHVETRAFKRIAQYYQKIKNYEEMKKYYLKAIERDDESAMFKLGLFYHDEKNYDEMKKYYLMAIEKENPIAMHNLGIYYKTEKNFDEMKKYLLMATEKGYKKSSYVLAKYYENTKTNKEFAFQYYKIAADKGEGNSAYYIGNYYKNEKNYDKMTKYYLIAIEDDNKEAMITLGIIDEERRIELFGKAMMIDVMLYEEIKKKFDEDKFLKIIEEVIDILLLKKNLDVRILFKFVSKNVDKYERLFMDILCESKDLERIRKCIQDYESCGMYDALEKSLLVAVKLGCSKSMFELGFFYKNRNFEEAKKYYMMAIENGNKVYFPLANLYRQEKNFEKAKKNYLLAVEQNHDGAMFELGNYYRFVEKKYDEMLKYWKMAAERKNGSAMYNLGLYYSECIKNIEEARKYYIMGANQGHSWSKKMLTKSI